MIESACSSDRFELNKSIEGSCSSDQSELEKNFEGSYSSDRAAQEENIEGSYNSDRRSIQLGAIPEINSDITPEINVHPDNNKSWQKILNQLKSQLTSQSFNTWFAGTTCLINNDTFKILCTNDFAKDWIKNRYHSILTEIIKELSPEIKYIEYDTQNSGSTLSKELIGAHKQQRKIAGGFNIIVLQDDSGIGVGEYSEFPYPVFLGQKEGCGKGGGGIQIIAAQAA